jgi:hypothetical protein
MTAFKRYLGFYLPNPCWALDHINIEELKLTPDLFTSEMSKIVIDVETSDFELKVCRDGMFLLRINLLASEIEKAEPTSFNEHLTAWSEYLNYTNTITIVLESSFLTRTKHAFFSHKEITNKDAFGVRFEDGKWAGHNIPVFSYAEILQNARYISQLPNTNIPLSFNSAFRGRQIISQDVFDDVLQFLTKYISNQAIISIISQISKALSEYKIGNFDTSLVLSWFIVESIIEHIWFKWLSNKNYDLDGIKRLNNDRFKNLNSRDYPINVKLNLLELNDQITLKNYKELDEVRVYRNKIVHSSDKYTCSLADASKALNCALFLISDVYSVKLELNTSLSISGL